MFPKFAYTNEMQIILAVIAFSLNTMHMYLIANLILRLYGEKTRAKQKLIFAFLTGGIIQTAYVYVVYFIAGAVSFSLLILRLVVNTNPLFAFLFCVIGVTVLKLSWIRSIKLIGHIYLYALIIDNIKYVLDGIVPAQTAAGYNYLIDAVQLIINFFIAWATYLIICHLLKKNKFTIRFWDKLFINFKKELFIFLLKALSFYIFSVALPLLITNQFVANVLLLMILILFLGLYIFMDILTFQRSEIENKEIHISALSKGISEFSSLKHDFYNILQTYGGYLHVGDLEKLREYHSSLLNLTTDAGNSMELGKRMTENPALVSLLINKSDYAEKANVKMTTSLKCSIDTLYLDTLDICRCIACLLDNAIEAATESEQKKVFFTIENKIGGSKLMIITNSTTSAVNVNEIITKGFTSKQGHKGLGLSNVRRIIEMYGNCTFQIGYYNYEFSAYIQLRQE